MDLLTEQELESLDTNILGELCDFFMLLDEYSENLGGESND